MEQTRVDTLDSEVRGFVSQQPYWLRYIAIKILQDEAITEQDLRKSYTFFLEELNIVEQSQRQEIIIQNNSTDNPNTVYSQNLFLDKLENVEGVNALVENQKIEFCPNLTILYGDNGSGKSSYVRLMKKAFYSKATEDILPNIHLDSTPKRVNANFCFSCEGEEKNVQYPTESAEPTFEQFAIFDNKSIIYHLDHKNKFEFRPSGLQFFSTITEVINRVEQLHQHEIKEKRKGYTLFDIISFFEGESEIKNIISSLSENSDLEEIQQLSTLNDAEQERKRNLEKKYDEQALNARNKQTKIRELTNIRNQLIACRQSIESLNQSFSDKSISNLYNQIADCDKKQRIAKQQGIQSFDTGILKGKISNEWKAFIESAHSFVESSIGNTYPDNDERCIFCHQELSDESKDLIKRYWDFLQSEAEQIARVASANLNRKLQEYQSINFDLLPDSSTLTNWLQNSHPEFLSELKNILTRFFAIKDSIVIDVENRVTENRKGLSWDTSKFETIIDELEKALEILGNDAEQEELQRIKSELTIYSHKEKLNIHISKIESFVLNKKWLSQAIYSWQGLKRRVTDFEKYLNSKYFSESYLNTFVEECRRLDGNFGIEIAHTGSGGVSYRQLSLKGNSPNQILSEGEQNVIAVADFLAEIQMSEVNRGIVFDDPVNSLDERRKRNIAERLAYESINRQVVIFTHDLIFLSKLIEVSESEGINHRCHWVERNGTDAGKVWLDSSPSFERKYRNSNPVKDLISEAKQENCSPSQREYLIKNGFSRLRTCYEVLVINDLFSNVVQRWNERVSLDSLRSVKFDTDIVDELLESFGCCCRFMEGHTHSDKYAFQKPSLDNLIEEMTRYEAIRTKIKAFKKGR